MFDVKAIKESFVTERTAGIESTANKMSAFSIRINANKFIVGIVFPSIFVKNLSDLHLTKYF